VARAKKNQTEKHKKIAATVSGFVLCSVLIAVFILVANAAQNVTLDA
jgi:hypothetical protein